MPRMEQPTSSSISVIVVSYHTGPALWVCLNALLRQQGVAEIIIVNNGNPAEVEAKLAEAEQTHNKIKLLSQHGNVGFAKACNMGVAAASGGYVLLLNPDAVLLDDDASLKMATLLADPQRSPQPWLVGGVLRNEKGQELRASRRNIMTPGNALREGLGLARGSGGVNLHTTLLPDHPSTVPAISGACMMMTRERYQSIGGLDEGYFLHVEDMDLCKRITDAGGSVWIHPDVDVLHFTSTSAAPAVVVEQHKVAGFKRYFATHYKARIIGRSLFAVAAKLRLAVLKLRQNIRARRLNPRRLTTPIGVAQVAAILRGRQAARLEKLTGRGEGTTVMVTGGSSSVALFAIGRLLEMGSNVIAVTHKSRVAYFHPKLRWVQADWQNSQEVQTKLQGITSRFVIHTAPVWLLKEALPVLKEAGMERLVAISSTSIKGKETSGDPDEQQTVKKLLDGELAISELAKELVFDWTIIRPTMIYGAGLDNNISRMARMADQWGRFPVELPAMGKRAPVHADDVATACLRALAVPGASGKTYNLQGASVLPFRALVERAAKLMDAELEVVGIPQFAQLLSIMHKRNPHRFPHPAVLARMKQDLLFPDESVEQDLRLKPREYLAGGMMDLGQLGPIQCYSLIAPPPAPQPAGEHA